MGLKGWVCFILVSTPLMQGKVSGPLIQGVLFLLDLIFRAVLLWQQTCPFSTTAWPLP